MPKTERRLAILGAGPIGLEAALYARALQIPFTIYERGRPGDHVWRWGHVRLFTPFGMNATPLGRAAAQKQKPNQALPGDEMSGRPAGNTSISTWGRLPSRSRLKSPDGHARSASRPPRLACQGRRSGGAGRAKQPFSACSCAGDKQNSASGSRKPTWCSTPQARTGNTAGWARGASRPSENWPPNLISATPWTTFSATRRTTTPTRMSWSSVRAYRRRPPCRTWHSSRSIINPPGSPGSREAPTPGRSGYAYPTILSREPG